MDSKQKEGKAANKRPKRLKIQPKRWPKRGWKGAAKSGTKRQKRAVQKGKKWGKVDSEQREGKAANKRPKRLKIKHRAANRGKG